MPARNEVRGAAARRILKAAAGRRGPGRKYRNQPTDRDGMRFDSKREAAYYDALSLLRKARQIRFFLRQVPFHLPGRTIYRVDFMYVEKGGGIRFVDVKGVRTETYKLKKRQVEALYGVCIEEA